MLQLNFNEAQVRIALYDSVLGVLTLFPRGKIFTQGILQTRSIIDKE